MPACVFVVGDSRGRGLADRLSERLGEYAQFIDATRGGATIPQIVTTVETVADSCLQYHHHRTVVIFVGGICSLTRRQKTTFGVETTFDEDSSHINAKIQTIKEDLQKLWEINSNKGIYTITTTILPVNLVHARAYNIECKRLHAPGLFSESEVQLQEGFLLHAIDNINTFIKEKTIPSVFPLNLWVNIHNQLEYHSLKQQGNSATRKVRTVENKSNHLSDGVHADAHLQNKIAARIAAACRRIIVSPPAREPTSSQSESEEPSSFKRRKALHT